MQAFTQDVLKDMDKWQSLGDKLIMMLDANKYIRSWALWDTLAETSMYKAMLHKYEPLVPPLMIQETPN